MPTPRPLAPIAALAVLALLLAGCSSAPPTAGPTGAAANGPYTAPTSETQVPGSGSTFAKPIIDAWATQYAPISSATKVSYAGGGSGTGLKDIFAGNVVFAGTDAPLSAADHAAHPSVLQFPESLGPVAIVYNLAGEDRLVLDGPTLGKIYTGEIGRWNDAALRSLNPQASLPDEAITIVYRSDSSGTTFVVTDYLGKTSPSWATTMGAAASKSPTWTKSSAKQVTGQGNDGVADQVKNTGGSIGYVEFAYVKSKSLSAAALMNKAGQAVMPSVQGATAAAARQAASLPAPDGDWSSVSIVDADGRDAYPISSFTYFLVHKSTADYGGKANAGQLTAFRAWAWWALHDGQKYATPLGYAPLPSEVVAVGVRALAMLAP